MFLCLWFGNGGESEGERIQRESRGNWSESGCLDIRRRRVVGSVEVNDGRKVELEFVNFSHHYRTERTRGNLRQHGIYRALCIPMAVLLSMGIITKGVTVANMRQFDHR